MEIITERLRMREFVEDDWKDVLAYQIRPAYLKYYEWQDRTEEDVRAFVRMFVDNQEESPRTKFQLAVTMPPAGQVIGSCGIRQSSVGANEAEMGFELDPAYWGHGYATEAGQAMVRFGFQELGLHRIEAWCIAENTGSWHILEKLGFQREGRLRDKQYFKECWWDTLLYAILKPDWQELQSEQPEH